MIEQSFAAASQWVTQAILIKGPSHSELQCNLGIGNSSQVESHEPGVTAHHGDLGGQREHLIALPGAEPGPGFKLVQNQVSC